MSLIMHDCNEMTLENFEKKLKEVGKPVLLKFSAKGCLPCINLKKALEGYETDHDVNMFTFDGKYSSNGNFAQKYRVGSFPTIILVDENAELIGGDSGKFVGFSANADISTFDKFIEKHKCLFGSRQ